MTMSELHNMGFEVVKCYTHDQFITQRRRNGNIMIETTWDRDKDYNRVSQDVMIDETYLETITKKDLLYLSKILNQ